jgi:hypothetical protein
MTTTERPEWTLDRLLTRINELGNERLPGNEEDDLLKIRFEFVMGLNQEDALAENPDEPWAVTIRDYGRMTNGYKPGDEEMTVTHWDLRLALVEALEAFGILE